MSDALSIKIRFHRYNAVKLENYLISTETQAKVIAFRSPGSDRQFW